MSGSPVFSNPLRGIAAIATLGGSEVLMAGAKEISKLTNPEAPQMPGAPQKDPAREQEAINDAARKERGKNGRASTIFAGEMAPRPSSFESLLGSASRSLLGR